MIYSKRYVETVCRSLHDWWDSTTNEELKNIWRKHIMDERCGPIDIVLAEREKYYNV